MVRFELSQDLARERRFLKRAAWMVWCGYVNCAAALYYGPASGLPAHQVALDYLGLLSLLALVLALPCAAIAARIRDATSWVLLACAISPLLARAFWWP